MSTLGLIDFDLIFISFDLNPLKPDTGQCFAINTRQSNREFLV